MRPWQLTLALATATAFPCSPATAQDPPSQESLQEKHQEVIGRDFVAFGGWLLDYDEARQKARDERKILLTYFTRSYSP